MKYLFSVVNIAYCGYVSNIYPLPFLSDYNPLPYFNFDYDLNDFFSNIIFFLKLSTLPFFLQYTPLKPTKYSPSLSLKSFHFFTLFMTSIQSCSELPCCFLENTNGKTRARESFLTHRYHHLLLHI